MMRSGFWRAWGRPAIAALITGASTVGAGMLSADSLDKYKLVSQPATEPPTVGRAVDKATTDKIAADRASADKIAAENRRVRSESPVMSAIADYRTTIIGILVLFSILPTISSVLLARRAREAARLEMLRRYMALTKQRGFPDADGVT